MIGALVTQQLRRGCHQRWNGGWGAFSLQAEGCGACRKLFSDHRWANLAVAAVDVAPLWTTLGCLVWRPEGQCPGEISPGWSYVHVAEMLSSATSPLGRLGFAAASRIKFLNCYREQWFHGSWHGRKVMIMTSHDYDRFRHESPDEQQIKIPTWGGADISLQISTSAFGSSRARTAAAGPSRTVRDRVRKLFFANLFLGTSGNKCRISSQDFPLLLFCFLSIALLGPCFCKDPNHTP